MTRMPDHSHMRQAAAKRAEALVKAYRQGDPDALGELVEMCRKPLFAFILRMTAIQSEADDIFQEVWFRAIKNMDGYKHKSFMSWLFRIAHNVVIDRARHRKIERLVASPSHLNDENRQPIDTVASSQPSPDRLIMAQETAGRIEAAVAKLPPEQREVFWLRMEADLPFREIARLQGTSINTALARMQYALEKIRKSLADLKETAHEMRIL